MRRKLSASEKLGNLLSEIFGGSIKGDASLDEDYLKSFLEGDTNPPSHYIYSSEELFDTIEDAKKYRTDLINGGDFI